MKIREFDAHPEIGFGGRAVLNFSQLLAADVQFARSSRKEFVAGLNTNKKYSQSQSTANLKMTWRPQNIPVRPFGLVGAGLARYGETFIYQVPPGSSKFYQNRFALRFGGGIEFVPHHRFLVRLDVSDLASYIPGMSGSRGSRVPARWWNRLDVSLSTMVRFGSMGSRGR